MQDPRLKIKEDLLHKLSWDHLLEEWKGEAEWPFWAVKPCLGLWKVQGASGGQRGLDRAGGHCPGQSMLPRGRSA